VASEQQLLDVLREFARTMVTDFPIQAILDHLVERIVDILPVTAAGVTLISPGVRPQYIAASNDAALRFEELQTEVDEGPCLSAYRTGEAVAVPDLRTEERFAKFRPRALDAGLAAVFTFPLHHGDHRLGALDLYRDTAGELSPQAMSWAQTLADVTAAYLLISQARAALQESSAQARYAALHDPLTGLPNRVLMVERLEQAFARVHGSRKIVAVFFIDLDRFKAVNDSYGHQVGDELLVAVAGRLTGVVRSDDTLGRLYGDEFVVLCEDLSGAAHAEAIVARVHASLAEPCVVSGIEVDVAASVGIAFAGHDPVNPEQLLHAADIAMYRAKHAGGSRHQIIDLRDDVRKSIHR
jgi:diguanylate cyclase (GGDEF)-like protein